MKLLSAAKAGLARLVPTPDDVREALKSGANGLYVYRPVLNAAEWAAWAVKHSVPNPAAAADLHVTLISSATDAKIPLSTDPIVVSTRASYSWCTPKFAFLGKDDNALCLIFYDYAMADRNYCYRNAGATMDFPEYIQHMTLSMDAKGFDLPDEALADCPNYIVLGAETRADRKLPDVTDENIAVELDDDGDDDADITIVVMLAADEKAAAAEALAKAEAGDEGFRDIDPLQMSTLRSMSQGHPVAKVLARHLSKAAWCPELLQKVQEKTDARGLLPPSQRGEEKTKDVTIKISQVSGEIAKNLGSLGGAKGYDEERRWVYGIANVSTIDGELIEDLDGDSFTTKCLEDYCAKLLLSQAGGDFEHEGDAVNKIVGAIVLSSDLQKSLGIDLGMEFLLTVTHVPDDADWEKVKKGEWMHSIAGVFYYED